MSENKIYEKCCVYKVQSLVKPEMVYYGSTNNFNTRMTNHKSDYKSYLNGNKHYFTVFDIYDLGDYKQEIVQEYENITEKQLHDFETTFIQSNKCVNKLQSMTTEMKKKIRKEWYEQNKDKLNKNNVCDICKGNFTTIHKSQHYKAKKHIKSQELLDKINNIQPKIKIKMKQIFNINNSKDITINTAIDKEAADKEREENKN